MATQVQKYKDGDIKTNRSSGKFRTDRKLSSQVRGKRGIVKKMDEVRLNRRHWGPSSLKTNSDS